MVFSRYLQGSLAILSLTSVTYPMQPRIQPKKPRTLPTINNSLEYQKKFQIVTKTPAFTLPKQQTIKVPSLLPKKIDFESFRSKKEFRDRKENPITWLPQNRLEQTVGALPIHKPIKLRSFSAKGSSETNYSFLGLLLGLFNWLMQENNDESIEDSLNKETIEKYTNLLESLCKDSDKWLSKARVEVFYLLQGDEAENFLLFFVKKLNDDIKYNEIFYLIFGSCSTEQSEILFPAIKKNLQNGHVFSKFVLLFEDCTEQMQNELLPLIIANLKFMKNDLLLIFQQCNEDQREKLFSSTIEFVKIDNDSDWLDYLFLLLHISDEQKTRLLSDEQKKGLLKPIIVSLKRGKIFEIELIFREFSIDEQNEVTLALITGYKQGFNFDESIIKIYELSDPFQKELLFPCLLEIFNKGKFYSNIITIFEKCSENQKEILFHFIEEHFMELCNFNDFKLLVRSCSPKQKNKLSALYLKSSIFSNFFNEVNPAPGQSHGHLIANLSAIMNFEYQLKKKPEALGVFLQAITNEKKILSRNSFENYYVFYRAQIWDLYWLELLYTKLWEAKYQQKAEHYLFTRYPEDIDCLKNAESQLNSKEVRKRLMDIGRIDEHRPSLLFLNYALFGNSNNVGSNSANYFLENRNVGRPNITTEDIFRKFDLQEYYKEHENELETLKKEFSNLSTYGNLLQIAMPEKYVKKFVYLSIPGGYKATAIIENTKTSEVPRLIDALKSNPFNIIDSDQKEFCWVATNDAIQRALKDKVEIHNFNTADPEQFNEVMHKTEKIIDRIMDQAKQQEPHKFTDLTNPYDCYKKHKWELENSRTYEK